MSIVTVVPRQIEELHMTEPSQLSLLDTGLCGSFVSASSHMSTLALGGWVTALKRCASVLEAERRLEAATDHLPRVHAPCQRLHTSQTIPLCMIPWLTIPDECQYTALFIQENKQINATECWNRTIEIAVALSAARLDRVNRCSVRGRPCVMAHFSDSGYSIC